MTPRVGNLSTVLTLVHRERRLSRAMLTNLTRLNRSTIAALVGDLVSRGLVVEEPAEPARRAGRPSPVVVPRWSCTLVEARVQSLLDRVGITIADLDEIGAAERRIAREAMRDDARRALEKMRSEIASLPTGVAGESEALGLTSAVEGATRSLQHRLDRLDRRIVAAIKRRDAARMRDVATLRGALRPNGGRQERVLNAIPLLTRNGCELLADMRRAAGRHAALLVDPALDERSPGTST